MKPPLLALLLLSLTGNAAMLFYVLRPSGPNLAARRATASDSSAAPDSGVTKSSPKAIAPAEVLTRLSAPALKTDDGMRTLVANLRAAGFPPNVVRAVINDLLSARFAERMAGPIQPFWQQPRETQEQAAASRVLYTALQKEKLLLFESLLGPDARLSATLDPRTRERRYGQLSDEKIDLIDKLNRDYNELRQAAGVQLNMRGTPADQREKEALLNEEKRKDLAALLSPEELAQYELRNSPASYAIINKLGFTTVTEDEFKVLYRLQQDYAAALPALAQEATEEARTKHMLQQGLAQEQLNERVRTVLGDERFYDYLRGTDGNYIRAAEFAAKYPAVTPAATYELSKLERAAQALLIQSRTLSPQDRVAAAQAFMASYNAKIVSLLSPEIAAAYQNQSVARSVATIAAPKSPRAPGP